MGRTLAGMATGLVLLAGCADVAAADAEACDHLFTKQDSTLEYDLPALQEIVDRLGPVVAGDTLTADLRPAMERVVSDARSLLDGGSAEYLDLHVLDALSVCMDEGW